MVMEVMGIIVGAAGISEGDQGAEEGGGVGYGSTGRESAEGV